ncbi:alpha/beta fold hydrolase [Nonomuraea sp. NPDC049400]|uniref:alpha/beta fold hydrolase n=1 Tax=Nonomuraea sp. NPDC049400 TaxID=3364352 RepID=UPI00379719F0
MPHRRDDVPSCAGSTHVVSLGSGSPTVVVVPGTNVSAALLESFASVLAPTFTVLLLDLPGQPGLSAGHRPRRDRLAWYGRWLADVLAQTVPDTAIVVGHSLGGAITLACDSPRIAGRVLVSTAGLTPLIPGIGVMRATIPWMLGPTPARSTALLRHFFAPGNTPPPHLVEWYTLIARACRTSLAPPVLPRELLAQRANVPRLVVTGQHDVFLPPRRLRGPASRRLGADLTVIPGAGHLVTDEQPQSLAALLSTMSAPAPG